MKCSLKEEPTELGDAWMLGRVKERKASIKCLPKFPGVERCHVHGEDYSMSTGMRIKS